MTGGGSFVGVLYAPYVNINTGGNATLYGAATCNSFSCNGTFDFHFDVSLTNTPWTTTLVIQSWAEN